jgi:hypothetical protein
LYPKKRDTDTSRPYTVKTVREFTVPSRDVTTKLSLGGNNGVITELYLPRGSLISDIPAGDGKLVNLFFTVYTTTTFPVHLFYSPWLAMMPVGWSSMVLTHQRIFNRHHPVSLVDNCQTDCYIGAYTANNYLFSILQLKFSLVLKEAQRRFSTSVSVKLTGSQS